MVDERPKEGWPVLEPPALTSSYASQVGGVLRCVVGQRVGFQPGPPVLNRIEFGCVRRQVFELEAWLPRRKRSDHLRAMGIEPIPDHDEGSSDLTTQLAEKGHDSRAIHGMILMQAETQPEVPAAAADDQGGDHRQFLVVAGALQQKGPPAAGTPRAPQQRRQQQGAFIDKHQTGLQPTGFFLMRRQSTWAQCRICSSSRSRARRLGRCGVQPKRRSNRPTWAT